MKQLAIFFVPTGATQRDFETALRKHFVVVEIDEDNAQTKPKEVEQPSADQFPLWTWFVPNPLS